MMNATPLYHATAALITQIIIGLLTGNWWVGAAAGAFFYLGREHDQAESRWISAFGAGKRINMPWYGGFDPRVWNKLDCWLDWIVPTLAVVGMACVVQYGAGRGWM